MWGRFPALLGFMQLAEAEPTMTDTIVNGMQKFAVCMNNMLAANYTGTAPLLVLTDWLGTLFSAVRHFRRPCITSKCRKESTKLIISQVTSGLQMICGVKQGFKI
jgi:hypothetical protein